VLDDAAALLRGECRGEGLHRAVHLGRLLLLLRLGRRALPRRAVERGFRRLQSAQRCLVILGLALRRGALGAAALVAPPRRARIEQAEQQ